MLLTHNHLKINHVEIVLDRLSKGFDGYLVVQLSDLHFYENTDPDYYNRVLTEVSQLDPDIIVVTGDIIHYGEDHIDQAGEFLAQLEAKVGKFSILGNHDYCDFAGSEKVREMLKQSGFDVLVNQHQRIPHPENELEGFYLAGVDDLWKGAPDLPQALRGLENSEDAVILLAHNPLMFDPVKDYKSVTVDLQLSGHTHAGHVYIPFLAPVHHYVFNAKYRYGLYKKNNTQLYVTSGVGSAAFYIKNFGLRVALPRFRFNTRPEIAAITLRTGK